MTNPDFFSLFLCEALSNLLFIYILKFINLLRLVGLYALKFKARESV